MNTPTEPFEEVGHIRVGLADDGCVLLSDPNGVINVPPESVSGVIASMVEMVTIRRARELASEMRCDDCGRIDGTHDPDVEH